jgi:DNA repair exonuclease SbcCD ATPase subunit
LSSIQDLERKITELKKLKEKINTKYDDNNTKRRKLTEELDKIKRTIFVRTRLGENNRVIATFLPQNYIVIFADPQPPPDTIVYLLEFEIRTGTKKLKSGELSKYVKCYKWTTQLPDMKPLETEIEKLSKENDLLYSYEIELNSEIAKLNNEIIKLNFLAELEKTNINIDKLKQIIQLYENGVLNYNDKLLDIDSEDVAIRVEKAEEDYMLYMTRIVFEFKKSGKIFYYYPYDKQLYQA